MTTSNSQAMGRMAEVISRTRQTARKMKAQRGPLEADEGTEADNARIARYVAKYTINPAITARVGDYIGSLEPRNLADIALWDPAFFGVKPEVVIKGSFQVWSQIGEANGSLYVFISTDDGLDERTAPDESDLEVLADGIHDEIADRESVEAGVSHLPHGGSNIVRLLGGRRT